MFARVSTYHGSDVDAFTKGFESVSRDVEGLAGFSGGYLLVDRASGEAMTITLWKDETALAASVEKANDIRRQAADTGGYSIDSVAHYEVATALEV